MKNKMIFIVVLGLIYAIPVFSQPVWTQKADYPSPARFLFSGFSLNGRGYIGGGNFAGAFNAQASWYFYDPASNLWNDIAPMPMPFRSINAFEIGGYGYVCNGVNTATYNYNTFRYNQPGNNWAEFASMSYPRLYSSTAVSGSKAYIIGGYGFMAEALNDVWEYNSITDSWFEKASLPATAARYNATSFTLYDKIYVFGGTDGFDNYNDIWEFDPLLNQWSAKSSLPSTGRELCISFVIDNEAYIVGGVDFSKANLKEVWKYDPLTDLWIRLDDFPGTNAPLGGIGLTINNKGYVFMGNGTRECWEFDKGNVGIIENDPTPEMVVSQNPVTDCSWIEILTPVCGKIHWIITNITGQPVKSFSTETRRIPVLKSGLNKGIYIVSAIAQDKKIGTIQLIIID